MTGKHITTFIITLTLTVLFTFCILTGCNKNSIVIKPGKTLNIPVSDITEKISFIPAIVDDIYMEIIIFKATDETIRAAFNTCERCYTTGMGYFIHEENIVICQQCNMHIPIESIGIQAGGCQPIPISIEEIIITDKSIRISYQILSANTHWFANWKSEKHPIDTQTP